MAPLSKEASNVEEHYSFTSILFYYEPICLLIVIIVIFPPPIRKISEPENCVKLGQIEERIRRQMEVLHRIRNYID